MVLNYFIFSIACFVFYMVIKKAFDCQIFHLYSKKSDEKLRDICNFKPQGPSIYFSQSGHGVGFLLSLYMRLIISSKSFEV
ncbi:hypothetical protein BpHYR1_043995 [Brachionus plicatilis]|uniref:Uncharacterized protein n=1 Tax=Brachionus plicatilis TaxID=10195 RepID=A0A3M7QT73_BRAPC|nr:hypothetical protein BpHYR1_043995 [Brachionus plicatilis]